MNTFLPYADIKKTAQCLDMRRLGKQRVEAYQILRTLLGETSGWKSHPAVRMWKGYESYLLYYALEIVHEWLARGYNDTIKHKLLELACKHQLQLSGFCVPPWLGNPNFHDSHKSNLLRKDPIWYGQFNWNVPSNLPYVWPVNKT